MLWVGKCTELFCVTRLMSSIMVLSFSGKLHGRYREKNERTAVITEMMVLNCFASRVSCVVSWY